MATSPVDRRARIKAVWRDLMGSYDVLQRLMDGQAVRGRLDDEDAVCGPNAVQVASTARFETILFTAQVWRRGWRTWYVVSCEGIEVGRID